MISHFSCVMFEVLLVLVFVFSLREAEVLTRHSEYGQIRWN